MMGLLRSGDVTQMVKYVTKMTAHRHRQTVQLLPLCKEYGLRCILQLAVQPHGESVSVEEVDAPRTIKP
jgi:hypothetical protein